MSLRLRNFLIIAVVVPGYILALFSPPPINSMVFIFSVLCSVVWGLHRGIREDALPTHAQLQVWHERWFTEATVRRLSQVALFLSILLLIWMMWFLHPVRRYAEARLAFSLLLPVILLFYPAVRLYKRVSVPLDSSHTYQVNTRKMQPEFIAGGIILLCLLTLSNILPVDMKVSPFISQHVQVLFFVVGLIVLTMGFCGYTARDLRVMLKWRLPGIILVITGVALLVRFWNLEFGIHRLVDEYHFMQAVGDLWHGGEQRMLLPHGGITAFTWLYPYLQWHSSMAMGASLTGLRLASVLIGTLQIPVIYLLGRELFNQRVGIVAALMLAIFPLHIQFSRIGLNNIADLLPGMLALFFLARGMKRGHQAYFVLAGLCLGLTHYFYEGGRLFYTLFVVLWLIWIRIFKQSDDGYHLPTRRQLLMMGGMFLLTVMPVYVAWWVNLFPLMPRMRSTSGGSLSSNMMAILGSNAPLDELNILFEPFFLMYVYTPDVSDFFAGERLLPWLTVAFFFIGAVFALYRLRQPGFGLVFWWMIGAPVGLALTINADPEVPRYVLALPTLALLIAIGVDESLKLLQAIFTKISLPAPAWQNGFAACMGVLMVGATIWQFHGVFLPEYYQRAFYYEYDAGKFARDSEDALFRGMPLPGESDVYLISPYIMNATSLGSIQLYYGRMGDAGIRLSILHDGSLSHTWRQMIRDRVATRHQYFFIDPDNYILLRQLREVFPDLQGGVMSPYDIPSEKQYAMYYQLTAASNEASVSSD